MFYFVKNVSLSGESQKSIIISWGTRVDAKKCGLQFSDLQKKSVSSEILYLKISVFYEFYIKKLY